MAQHSEEDMKKFENFFRDADTDNSNCMSYKELKAIFKNMGFKGTDDEMATIFVALDADGDKKVTYDEYISAVCGIPPKNVKEAHLRKAFQDMDASGDGFIDAGELKKVLEQQGEKMSEEEIQEIIKDADKDSDGKVKYEEFLAAWNK